MLDFFNFFCILSIEDLIMMRLTNLHMNEFNSIQSHNFKFYFLAARRVFETILCLLFKYSLFYYKFYFSFKFLKINFGKKRSIFECIL